MQPQTPSSDAGAPAATGPEVVSSPQVEIALGPDVSIYPQDLRPPAELDKAAPPVDLDKAAPEPDETSAAEQADVAGAESSPQSGETRGARRRAAEDAYQRGLTEGKAAYEREQQLQAQREQADRTQREASERVDQLFQLAESPDLATRDQAWRQILGMYRGNRQAQALTTATRQQILTEMAADFGKLKDLDSSITDDDYQKLHAAPSVVDLAKLAFDYGKRARDEQVARLEAELQGLRGRLVGSRATPEAHNGASADMSGGISIDEYLAMSPKDARKLSSAQIDALTQQLAVAAERNGR
jgi:hypothetical protein